MYGIAKELKLDYTEEEFVLKLSEHFERSIRHASMGQQVKDKATFLKILNDYDNDDQRQKIKQTFQNRTPDQTKPLPTRDNTRQGEQRSKPWPDKGLCVAHLPTSTGGVKHLLTTSKRQEVPGTHNSGRVVQTAKVQHQSVVQQTPDEWKGQRNIWPATPAPKVPAKRPSTLTLPTPETPPPTPSPGPSSSTTPSPEGQMPPPRPRPKLTEVRALLPEEYVPLPVGPAVSVEVAYVPTPREILEGSYEELLRITREMGREPPSPIEKLPPTPPSSPRKNGV